MTPRDGRRVPPFGNPRIKARKTAPRGLSQSTTSFIGPWCQGIHRTPIKTTHNTGRNHAPEPTTPRTAQQDPGARHTTKTHHREQRYSRPLYSSQPTHPHPHNPPHHHQTSSSKQPGEKQKQDTKGHAAPDPDSMPPPPHNRRGGHPPPTHRHPHTGTSRHRPGSVFPCCPPVRPPRRATRGPGDAPVRAPRPLAGP